MKSSLSKTKATNNSNNQKALHYITHSPIGVNCEKNYGFSSGIGSGRDNVKGSKIIGIQNVEG